MEEDDFDDEDSDFELDDVEISEEDTVEDEPDSKSKIHKPVDRLDNRRRIEAYLEEKRRRDQLGDDIDF